MTECCAVVPVYDHERAVEGAVASLRERGMPVILVDDGSGPSCAAVLERLASSDACISLHRLPQNQGKGAAVLAGFDLAAAAGYTHVLQIDADGQHDATSLPRFLAAAAADPDALICGRPVFDASIPRHRRYLRYLTHAMVWLNTLSFDIPDAMCGLRIYPLAVVMRVLAAEPPGRRMDFDVEAIVRLHWRGVRMRWLPVGVGYPTDGVSHFRMVRDNWLITCMHTRLFFGMLRRLPQLLPRKMGPAAGGPRVTA